MLDPFPTGFLAHDYLEEVETFFSPKGPMAAAEHYEFRPQQQRMALEIARSLQDAEPLIVEAGTGVGKSLAYLAPGLLFALETDRKMIVSTHTINLQEQLMTKDLPLVQRLLGKSVDAVLLKGRQNYLCTTRLKRALEQAGDLFERAGAAELDRIMDWAQTTEDGTLSDLPFEPSHGVWSAVCSEPNICTTRSCPPGSGCHYQTARRRVMQARVVVLNHTLFFMLLAGREQQQGSPGEGAEQGFIFPRDFVVLDEAHTVEAIAAQQLGYQVSDYDVRAVLSRLWNPRTRKGLLGTFPSGEAIQKTVDCLDLSDGFFERVREACPFPRGDHGRECRVRERELTEDDLSDPLLELQRTVDSLARNMDNENLKAELRDARSRIEAIREAVTIFMKQKEPDLVYWAQRFGKEGRSLRLHSTPIQVDQHLQELLFFSGARAVLTSATLSAGPQEMDYFCHRVGASNVRQEQIGSPFDYENQMELILVKSMPDPRSPQFEDGCEKWITHFLNQTAGGAFVLFTSYRLMQAMAARLENYCKRQKWPLLVQSSGGGSRHRLVEQFKKSNDSVLFGTDSFWSGVDVPGEALRSIIITRLPFAVPDHPIIAARMEKIEAEGGDSFMSYSVPEAILKLRQGVGRLIRSKKDHGIVAILDNRIVKKNYGRAFIQALPECPVKVV